MRFVLASASPRRLDLLRQIGFVPDAVEPAGIEEMPLRNELPRQTAVRLATAKAKAVAARYAEDVVLAADTVVACGRRDLPKATTRAEARAALVHLSGRRHRVHTGLCLIAPGARVRTRLVCTVVTFKRLHASEVDAYLDAGEWRGKAGGYAIQGRAAALVRHIGGSYSNVVGLPLFETHALLTSAGLRPKCADDR